jgi:hypothetical protein
MRSDLVVFASPLVDAYQRLGWFASLAAIFGWQ